MDEQSIDTNTEKEWNLNFHGNSYMIDILSQGNIIIITIITNIIISSMTTIPSLLIVIIIIRIYIIYID